MSEAFHEDYNAAQADWLVIANFFVAGDPKGQPRPKFARRGKHTVAYTPNDGPPAVWKELLFWQAKKHVPAETFEGPVRIWITAYAPRPKEYLKPCYPNHPIEFIQKPDRDNIEKMVLDVFTNLGFYADDKQVCGGEVRKYYCGHGDYEGPGEKPGANILIEINRNWPYKTAKSPRRASQVTGGGSPQIQLEKEG